MQFVSSMTVKNFKSIKSATFRLEKYTPIVGQNNAGKSNSIAALKWLLKKERLNENDFNDNSKPIEVEGVIDGITDEILGLLGDTHKKKIEEYINGEQISIKRIQPLPTSTAAQIILEVYHPVEQVWKPNPTGIDNAIRVMFPDAI